MTYAVRPEFSITVYPFANTSSEFNKPKYPTVDYYTDVKAFLAPVPVPMEYVESFSYNDELEKGDFSIEIHRGMYVVFEHENRQIALDELLSVGHLVCFHEQKLLRFTGYILKRNRQENASGQSQFNVSGSGLEGMIERQLLTIDLSPEYKSNAQFEREIGLDSDVLKYMTGLSAGLQTLTSNIKEMRTPGGIIRNLFEGVVNLFLNKSLFGGSQLLTVQPKPASTKSSSKNKKTPETKESFDPVPDTGLIDAVTGISSDSYSQNMVHSLSWINQASFGNQINYWNLMETMSPPPLYEMFFHYNESDEFWISPEQNIPDRFQVIKGKIGNLVFRKTPFMYLHNWYLNPDDESDLLKKELEIENRKIEERFGQKSASSSDDNPENSTNNQILFYKLPEDRIISFDLEDNLDDIFTGIQVTLNGFEAKKSVHLIPVLYNPALILKHGQRVMTVKLEGLNFQNKNKTDPEKEGNNYVKNIRELLYKHFGQGQKIVSGSMVIDYDRSICKGKILQIERIERNPASKVLDRYMEEFYITGVKVSANPGSGDCSMTLSLKWGEVRTRTKGQKVAVNMNRTGEETETA